MSSDFAGTETMLNSDHIVGGGRNPLEASASGMQAELVFLDSSSKKRRNKVASQKGGKPLFRTLRSNIRRLVPQEFGRELYANVLASYTRNDLQKGGAGLTVCTPFYYEGGVELRKQFWSPFVRKGAVC